MIWVFAYATCSGIDSMKRPQMSRGDFASIRSNLNDYRDGSGLVAAEKSLNEVALFGLLKGE